MPNENTQGNTQGQQQLKQAWADAKYVERSEMAIMQFVILGKAQQGEVTRENLQQTFRGNFQMETDHFDHCIKQLVSEGHLKEQGNKYTITDDGREDVQKLQRLFLEVPNVAGIQGQGGQTRQQQTQTVGGRTGGMGGSTTGTTTGTQGNVGTGSRQGSDVGQTQGQNLTGGSVNKGGASNPSGQKGNQR